MATKQQRLQVLLKKDLKNNAHNNYPPREIEMYKEVCKNLIDIGYEIKMHYPCFITIEYRRFNGISAEEEYYYSD